MGRRMKKKNSKKYNLMVVTMHILKPNNANAEYLKELV